MISEDLPQWIVAFATLCTSSVAVGSFVISILMRRDVKIVKTQTDGIQTALKIAAKAEGDLDGRAAQLIEQANMLATGKELVRIDAIKDAETAATVKAVANE